MRFLFMFVLLFGMGNAVVATEPAQSASGSEVKADVLYWEDEELIVREITGHEMRLRVTPDTKITGVVSRLKTGDKIVAQVTAEGLALSIALQIPDSGSTPVPPAMR